MSVSVRRVQYQVDGDIHISEVRPLVRAVDFVRYCAYAPAENLLHGVHVPWTVGAVRAVRAVRRPLAWCTRALNR